MSWAEGTLITGYRTDNSKTPTAVFLNTYTGDGVAQFPPDTWVTVDCVPLGIPVTAVAVFLCGLLIITHGLTDETADLWIAFRAPGDTLAPGNYTGQVIEAAVGNGQRTNLSTWIPLVGGKFQLYWHRSTTGAYPANSAYAINLAAQLYLRPSV